MCLTLLLGPPRAECYESPHCTARPTAGVLSANGQMRTREPPGGLCCVSAGVPVWRMMHDRNSNAHVFASVSIKQSLVFAPK